MGLLDYADAARKKLAGLLGDMPLVQMMQGRAEMPTQAGLLGALKSMPVFSPDAGQSAYEAALNIGPMGLGKIVYHGSPHKFDKFDASKIGTGEGAQAYGHGVYLADAPDVAQSYTKGGGAFQKSSPAPNVMIGDKWAQTMPRDSLESQAATVFANDLFGATIPEKVKKLRSANMGPVADFLEKNADQFRLSNGEFYKADLPDEWIPKMLDWDKPLSQQSPEVQKAIDAHIGKVVSFDPINDTTFRMNFSGAPIGGYWGDKNKAIQEAKKYITGKQFYEAAGKLDNISYPDSAAFLKDQGIPGIRYLDGGSRPNSGRITMLEQTIANLKNKGASKAAIANTQHELDAELARASYNYVVFPGLEDQVKILERNGVPLGLLGGM